MNLFSLKTKNYKLKTNYGFVALFAMLISSIILTISFGLLQIALKEIMLSSAGRESQFGFYAADAGTECALYWDIKGATDVSSVFASTSQSTLQSSGVFCGNQDIATKRGNLDAWSFVGTPTSATTTFWLSVGSKDACSKVEVGKKNGVTIIQSYGYNTCQFSDPKVIERALRITY